jgi:hypothetical protein
MVRAAIPQSPSIMKATARMAQGKPTEAIMWSIMMGMITPPSDEPRVKVHPGSSQGTVWLPSWSIMVSPISLTATDLPAQSWPAHKATALDPWR